MREEGGKEVGFLQKVLNARSKCVSGRLVEAMCDRISSLCLGESVGSWKRCVV